MALTLHVSISDQTLTIQSDGQVLHQYSVSTAENGINNQKDSGGTPLGKHIIRAKIGTGQLINAVFIGRRPTGEIWTEEYAKIAPDRDWILTRILWLSGTEVGVNRLGNVDSMQRYIYIHGTPDTEPMGIPKSHGCIRMRNDDLLTLFDLVDVNTEVNICA